MAQSNGASAEPTGLSSFGSSQSALSRPEASIPSAGRSQYNLCDGCGWVCENHPYLSWEPESDSPYACGCGAGMPCPGCKSCLLPTAPIATGSLTNRFVEPLKFARYYIVEALEIQEQSDLRDALVTLDWLIDGDEA